MVIENRKARYNYELLDRLDAGLQLSGPEVKSLREGKGSLQEAYCFFRKSELFIKNMYIAPYSKRGFVEVDSRRLRKLLMNRHELGKWQTKAQEKGLSIVPLRLFFSEKGWAKLQIGLGKGKKLHDKRQSIRKKEDERMLARLRKRSHLQK